MKILSNVIVALVLLLSNFSVVAQCNNPPNEECNLANTIALTSGDTVCVSSCNTGASNNNILLTGNACDDISGPTVFYTFTVTDGQLDYWITADFPDPQMTLMTEDCSQFLVQGCATGTDSTASITGFNSTTGETYTLVISSLTGNTGDFQLCVISYPDPSACNTNDILIATPPPDTSGGQTPGSYTPGTTVEYCYTIDPFNKIDCNWLHGIVPIIGEGWDMSSFTVTLSPASADGSGVWVWESADTGIAITHNITGDTVNLNGGWFYLNNCGPCPTHNGDPNLSWGDGQCGGFCQCDEAGSGFTWQVCFQLTTPDICVEGADLSVGMKTYADGQIGWWTNVACEVDAATFIYAVSTCPACSIDTIITTNVLCFGDSTGSAVVTMDTSGARPYTYSWNTIPVQTDSVATGLPAGTYSVTVTDANGCVAAASVNITEPVVLIANTTGSLAVCSCPCAGSAYLFPTGGTPPYTIIWSNGYTDQFQTGLCDGVYTVALTDANGCTATGSVTLP